VILIKYHYKFTKNDFLNNYYEEYNIKMIKNSLHISVRDNSMGAFFLLKKKEKSIPIV